MRTKYPIPSICSNLNSSKTCIFNKKWWEIISKPTQLETSSTTMSPTSEWCSKHPLGKQGKINLSLLDKMQKSMLQMTPVSNNKIHLAISSQTSFKMINSIPCKTINKFKSRWCMKTKRGRHQIFRKRPTSRTGKFKMVRLSKIKNCLIKSTSSNDLQMKI